MTDRRTGVQREDILQEVQELRKDFIDHTEDDRKIAEKVFEYHRNLDEHLANNGVESKRLSSVIDTLAAKVDEMYEPYRDAKGVGRTIKWGTGILLGLSAVVGALRYLIFK